MKIYVQSLSSYSLSSKVLTVNFDGRFSYGEGEKFSQYAEYDEDGKLVNCSSGSSNRNPLYYIEIAEVYKAMLSIEGEQAKKAYQKACEIELEYKDKGRKFLNDSNLKEIQNESILVNEELKGLESKFKRLKKLSSIEECQNKISDLKNTNNTLKNKILEIENKFFSINDAKNKKIQEIIL